MDEEVIIRVDFAYRALAALPRGRTFSQHLMRGQADVLVRSVADAAAPVVIDALWDGGRVDRMTWRTYEDALWRPVVAADGKVLSSPGEFEGMLAPGVRQGEWRDYPFALHAPGDVAHGRLPFGGYVEMEKGSRVERDDRHVAHARAQATAAEDLLFVGGVMHRRSVAPVWSVGSGPLTYDPGAVNLAMPDLALREEGLSSFPLDRRDDAMAFAALCVERVKALPPARLVGRDPQAYSVKVGRVALEHDALDFPAERVRGFLRSAEVIDEGLSVGRLSDFSRAFHRAYADFGSAMEALADTGWQEPMDAAASALHAMVAAEDPEWAQSWPRVKEVMDVARLQAWRHEFDGRRLDYESDMEAVSGLLP